MTRRAIGAAAWPPAPAATIITATATLGFSAGAKATNQAVVLRGSGAASAVGRSSAVPVLPATVTPGIAAAVPVPPRTTPIIMSRTWAATFALTARRRTRLAPARWGLTRTPWLAIVAPTEAMPSGVARSLFWPIALVPTASASLSSDALGIEFGLAAGTSGCSLKPKRSAAATRRLAPILAPSGPKTELQDSAKDTASEPPQDSSLALRSLTPLSTAQDRTG